MAWGGETCRTGVEYRTAGLGTNLGQLEDWKGGPGLALATLVGRRECTVAGRGGSGTFWAFLMSPPQQRLIGPGLPSRWGKSLGRVTQCPSPLSGSGTGEGGRRGQVAQQTD